MSAFKRILGDLDKQDFEKLQTDLGPFLKQRQELRSMILALSKATREATEELRITGKIKDISRFEGLEAFEEWSKNAKKTPRNSQKENIEPPPTGRSQRKTKKTKNIDQLQHVFVKVEKLSIRPDEVPSIKKEIEEMPAPTRPPPKMRKQRGTSKVQVKLEKVEETVRGSDVIIQNPVIPTISLDSDEEVEKRSTRTRTRKKKAKRSRSGSEEDAKQNNEKRSKSADGNEEFVDAVSTLNENETKFTFVNENPTLVNNDATFIAPETRPLDATVVIENPKYVKNDQPLRTLSDLMTDDESFEEPKKETTRKPIKPIFSPVKMKVQAFEKLQQQANAAPHRATRSKTRAQTKQQDEENEPKSIVKEKSKMFTPVTTKFFPKAASTSTKPRAANTSSVNDSILKSNSALKASQAEYRERERKRREKEEEAAKKREALLQAQIQDKKTKREEKQLKAQQQREALEKEKQKALEVQKLKKQKEVEKKQQMAKMKAIEEKKEKQKRIHDQKEMATKVLKEGEHHQKPNVPIYMKTKAPLLPTNDCYDSDDERYDPRHKLPQWTQKNKVMYMQKIAFFAGEAVKNSFFSVQAQTPDLQDIFEVIEARKLKRTSSAVWRKAPRFTMIQGLDSFNETEEFD